MISNEEETSQGIQPAPPGPIPKARREDMLGAPSTVRDRSALGARKELLTDRTLSLCSQGPFKSQCHEPHAAVFKGASPDFQQDTQEQKQSLKITRAGNLVTLAPAG